MLYEDYIFTLPDDVSGGDNQGTMDDQTQKKVQLLYTKVGREANAVSHYAHARY